MPTLRPPPITRLPQELVELIISYFIHNTHTLLACSMTCYSWYIAAVSHLHHTLTASGAPFTGGGPTWPTSLRNSYKLGLLPLVKKLRIRTLFKSPFTP